MQVKLSDILAALDFTDNEYGAFYRVKTGTIEMDDEDFFGEMDPAFDPDIEDVINLPNQWEIDDRQIMFDFVDQLHDNKQIDLLQNRLHGHKPYRRFQAGVRELGIQSSWDDFQTDAYRKIAVNWAHENDLEIIE